MSYNFEYLLITEPLPSVVLQLNVRIRLYMTVLPDYNAFNLYAVSDLRIFVYDGIRYHASFAYADIVAKADISLYLGAISYNDFIAAYEPPGKLYMLPPFKAFADLRLSRIHLPEAENRYCRASCHNLPAEYY